MADEKIILGLVEVVTITNDGVEPLDLPARIDTGAQNSSIDLALAQKLRLGPITSTKSIRSSHGTSMRPVVQATITVAGKTFTEEFTLYNRSHMKYKILVGQNILKKGNYLIDPSKPLP